MDIINVEELYHKVNAFNLRGGPRKILISGTPFTILPVAAPGWNRLLRHGDNDELLGVIYYYTRFGVEARVTAKISAATYFKGHSLISQNHCIGSIPHSAFNFIDVPYSEEGPVTTTVPSKAPNKLDLILKQLNVNERIVYDQLIEDITKGLNESPWVDGKYVHTLNGPFTNNSEAIIVRGVYMHFKESVDDINYHVSSGNGVFNFKLYV